MASDKARPGTGPWRALFSYRGELSRRAFVGWMTALLAGVLVAALTIFFVGELVHARGVALVASAIVMVGGVLWCGFALQAKRFRHIGLNPLIGILVSLAVPVALKWLWPVLSETLHDFRRLDSAWNLGFLAFLALWPGRARPKTCAVDVADVATAFD